MATVKQQIAVREVLKGASVAKAMRKANYGPSMDSHTQKLTKSKGWQELMEKYVGDKKLAELHKKLLNKKEIVITAIGKGYSQWEYTGQPHSDATKALDLAYKVRSKMPSEGSSDTKVLIINMLPDANGRYATRLPSSPEGDSTGQTQV